MVTGFTFGYQQAVLGGVSSDQTKLQLSVSIVLRVDHYVQYLVKCDVASFVMRLAWTLQVYQLENRMTGVIHREISTIRQEMNANNWRMIIWMTAVIGMAFSGVFYVARYAA